MCMKLEDECADILLVLTVTCTDYGSLRPIQGSIGGAPPIYTPAAPNYLPATCTKACEPANIKSCFTDKVRIFLLLEKKIPPRNPMPSEKVA